MDKKIKQEVINNMEEDLIQFVDMIDGADRILSEEENKQLDKVVALVNKLSKNPDVDVDLMVTVQYRLGLNKKKAGVTKTLRKSMSEALKNGFKIPAEAAYVQINVRPMVLVPGLDGEMVKKQYKPSFFDRKIFLGLGDMSLDDAKKLYGLEEKDQLIPVSEFKGNEILRFENTTYSL